MQKQGIRRRNLDVSNFHSVFEPELLLLRPDSYVTKPEASLRQ